MVLSNANEQDQTTIQLHKIYSFQLFIKFPSRKKKLTIKKEIINFEGICWGESVGGGLN